MAKQAVLCDSHGTLKAQQINGKQAELADLLATNAPSTAPSADTVASVLSTIPTPEGLARVAQNRWARAPYCAGHQAILDALFKLFENEASSTLKAPAQTFLTDFRATLVKLVQDSLALFGACEGAVYDDVFGEGADKSSIPPYLPVVSYFQLHFHEIDNQQLQRSWDATLAACGAVLPAAEAGLGSSPSRRALVYLLSMAEDVSYLRLCQALLHASCEFSYQ